MRALIFLLACTLAGCADLSPQTRWRHADTLADQAGWMKLIIPTGDFNLAAYEPKHFTPSETLTIYIEGDGLAWLSSSRPSPDPTPRNPVGLGLAIQHPLGQAVYLARPCQYVGNEQASGCKQTYWTNGRFSAQVITASDQAISELKQRHAARKLVLVGYSGGGAVAALVAARRNDIALLVTVAGNMDHQAWTSMHHVSPLDASLNPADKWRSLAAIPQRHYVGAQDEVVSRATLESYASRFPLDHRPRIIEVPGFDHACCWVEQWGRLWDDARD